MKPTHLVLIVGGIFTIAASWWIGLGSELGPVILMALGFAITITVTAHLMARDVDRDWLPKVVTIGYLIKLCGSVLRYYFTAYIYNSGDAISYHAAGARLAGVWRDLEVPEVVGRSMGTRFVELVTGLLYTPHIPHVLGGFIIFATVAFIGQLFFYAAFRHAFPQGRLRMYAWLVFLLPALSFWPSSIGKDALMVLFLGAGSYAAVRLFDRYELRWLILLGLASWGAGTIRAHVAGLLLAIVAVVTMIARGPGTFFGNARRFALLALIGLGVAIAAQQVADTFRFDLEAVELDPVVSDIERRTGQGGAELSGEAVDSVADLPGAFIRVLFSPLPHQAHNAQALFAALETTFLLALFIKESPWIARAVLRARQSPYWLMSALYTLGFTAGFSAVLNAGILARQRSQVVPLLLVMMVAARTIVEASASGDSVRSRRSIPSREQPPVSVATAPPARL